MYPRQLCETAKKINDSAHLFSTLSDEDLKFNMVEIKSCLQFLRSYLETCKHQINKIDEHNISQQMNIIELSIINIIDWKVVCEKLLLLKDKTFLKLGLETENLKNFIIAIDLTHKKFFDLKKIEINQLYINNKTVLPTYYNKLDFPSLSELFIEASSEVDGRMFSKKTKLSPNQDSLHRSKSSKASSSSSDAGLKNIIL